MTKKITAYIHILIANIILLAFVVIPHHHHHAEVCFMSSHCQSNTEANSNQSHQHDGTDSNNDNCKLVNAAFIPSFIGKSSFELKITEKSFLTSTFFDIPFYNYIIEAAECSVLVSSPPSVNAYPSHIRASHGLRAPPTV